MVFLKDTLAARSKAVDYLGPEIIGGGRKLKNFERMLRTIGVLPNGMYIVPGAACPLDAHGNIPRGLIVQILSYFKAFRTAGFTANITDKRKAALLKGSKRKGTLGYEYFVVNRVRGRYGRQHLPFGIYKRIPFAFGSSIKPIFMFVRNPTYPKRYGFYDVAGRIVKERLKENFIKALVEALSTTRTPLK